MDNISEIDDFIDRLTCETYNGAVTQLTDLFYLCDNPFMFVAKKTFYFIACGSTHFVTEGETWEISVGRQTLTACIKSPTQGVHQPNGVRRHR